MSETELRKLKAVIEDLDVNEHNHWDKRCTQDKDGIVYCAAKLFMKDHVETGGFAAAKDEQGNMQYIELYGNEKVVQKIHRELGKGALR